MMKTTLRLLPLTVLLLVAACSAAPEVPVGDDGEPVAEEQAGAEESGGPDEFGVADEPAAAEAEPVATEPEVAAPDDAVVLEDVTAGEQDPIAADGRRHLLDRVDNSVIVQLYADGFDALSRDDKLLAYHLSQAAIAGRDINLDQRFVYNLPLRWILESLWLVRAELPDDVRLEIERYCKLFWVHSGIHDNLSTQKNLLRLSWDQFAAACATAHRAGHELGARQIVPLRDLREAYAVMSGPDSYRSVTDKSTEDGKDPLLASCNNLYDGVASADLDGFVENNGLNSRLVKRDGHLVEEIYRCGDGRNFAPGRYAEQIAAVNEHLVRAMAYAPPATRAAIEKLVRYNQTGRLEDWREFNIAWLQDNDSTVDFILGFVEVYLDARGIKGSWESVISYRDEHKTKAIAELAVQAPWFEARMPWDERFKKASVKGISARAINVIMETGDSGPITPIGINLPNEADVRQQYGSKSVNLANVVEAYNLVSAAGSLDEFSFTAAEAERARRYGSAMDDMHTNLHEVVGHASGQVLPEITNPAQRLGLFYSTLEEGRADLVGLYWIADQKLKDMGLVPNDDAVLAKYEAYARNALVQLRRVPKGGRVEEDHMRNRQLIVHWLLANDGGVRKESRNGKTFYVVDSAERFRDKCGELLAEIMRIKAEGDFAAGKALVETYGVKVDPTLHAEVMARIDRLNLPSVTGFVQPELGLIRDEDGNITDVEVYHCQDLADQMLRWSGRQ
ncbi:MAG: peptidase M49 [Planctomycetes bacterium]|nr:peptidase M49 [Planctomycetota bacterium]